MTVRRVILTAVSSFDPSPFKDAGYEPVRANTIKLSPNKEEVLRLKQKLMEMIHDSAVFMSPRSIDFINPCTELIKILSKIRLYAVGPSTKESLKRFGLKNTRMPHEYTSRALVQYLVSEHIESPFSSIALIRSGFADNSMFNGLVAKGIPVSEYHIYSPEIDPQGVEKFFRELRLGADFVVFTSRSSFELLIKFLSSENYKELESLLKRSNVVAIGPETARSLKSLGIESLIIPSHSINGVLYFLR